MFVQQFVPINPRPMLQNLYVLPTNCYAMLCKERGPVLILRSHRVNEEVIIRLKWGQTEYKGRLVSIDSYMNIQLSGAEEWIDQQMTSALGQVLIRYAQSTEKNRGGVLAALEGGRERMLGNGARIMLISTADVITYYGSKPLIRITEMTQRWKADGEI
jgi:small nuclear ribonucleoprotein F